MLHTDHDNNLLAQHRLSMSCSSNVDHTFSNKLLYRIRTCAHIQCAVNIKCMSI